MNPVDPQFVKSLMENIYGNDENLVDTPSAKDAEKACEDHASSTNGVGVPKNVGNAWKAPAPLKESVESSEDSVIEERLSNLEEGLASILESLKTIVSNINEEEKFIKHERTDEKPKKKTDISNVTKNLDLSTPKGRERAAHLKRVADAKQLEKEKPTRVHGGQALSKKDIDDAVAEENAKEEK